MKAVISSTYDSKYLYFLPIVTYCWNKIGLDVICFMPDITLKTQKEADRYFMAQDTILKFGGNESTYWFAAPEHKEATYAQVSRLYGACLDLPEDEILITSDVDMAVFKVPYHFGEFTITGIDLVPKGQYPICYISASVKDWRIAFDLHNKSYQECLDETIGLEECENMRGNLWCRDQETAFNKINLTQGINFINRSNGQNQFAQNRYDRDDSFILDRLSPDTVDYHMNRPGYEDKKFEIILTILKYHYPQDDFTWLINFTEQYKQLL